MSLLLDALKKASDDKKQQEAQQSDDASLELDLPEADFPEVEIDHKKQTQQAEAVETPAEADAQHTENIETHQELEEPSVAEPEPEPEPEPEISITEATVDTQENKDDIVEINQKPPYQAEKNVQALSALINKSNQYTKARRKKRLWGSIALLSLVILILAAYGAYLFNTQADSLYIPTAVNQKQAVETKNIQQSAAFHHKETENKVSKQRLINKKTKTKTPPAKAAINKKPATKKASINVQRRKIEDPINLLLQQAYHQYQQGRYADSLKNYKQIIETEKYNPDAWLGMAANYIKLGDYALARQSYRRLLNFDPDNSYAQAGMAMLTEAKYLPQQEAELKSLIQQQPNAAHLYFALGALYGKNNQWAAAQSAYFKAWSLENNNPDYAYNLAVSLDHIGQNKSALKFYQKALQLNNNNRMDIKALQQRIKTLQESLK